MSCLIFITVLFTNFVEGSGRITFSLNWKFTCENNISKSITKCLLRLFVSTLHHSCPPTKFLLHLPNSFCRYFNVKSHLKYSCKYKSWKFIFCLHFFIGGVKSGGQAGLLLPFLGQSHRLPVALYRFGKRLTINWPWSFNIIFLHFSSNWTHIFTTKI